MHFVIAATQSRVDDIRCRGADNSCFWGEDFGTDTFLTNLYATNADVDGFYILTATIVANALRADGNGAKGISIYGATSSYTNLTANSNGGNGITIENNQDDNGVACCRSRGNTGYGLRLGTGTDNNVVTSIRLRDNTAGNSSDGGSSNYLLNDAD